MSVHKLNMQNRNKKITNIKTSKKTLQNKIRKIKIKTTVMKITI